MNELTFKLYSPLTAELVCHDPEDWCSDEVLALDGRAIVENEAEILAQIEQEGDHLEQYLDTESDSYLAAHVKSIVVSVEKRNGSLCGCATVVVDEDLTKRGWKELKDYLSGQYSDGWGEGFEQRDIQIAEGILNVHFWQPENFDITVVLAETRSQAEQSAANVAATGNGNRTLQPPQPDKKYEITDIAHPVYPELHRIRALRQVRDDVPAGELGGFVQSEANLSQGNDDAWLYDDSVSRDEACVCDDARLYEQAMAQDLALARGSVIMYGNAIACDNAIVTGGRICNGALVCGNARVRENTVTHIAPVVAGHCVVMGDLAGKVVVSGSGSILPKWWTIPPRTRMPLTKTPETNIIFDPSAKFEMPEHAGGDGWTILHGDCLRLMRQMQDGVFDAVITDPPYASGGSTPAEKNKTTNQKYSSMTADKALPDFAGDQMDQRSWTNFMTDWLNEAYRLCKPGAPICLFIDWRQYPSLSDAMQRAGWIWRGVAVWDKVTCRPQKGRFRQQAEFILWGSKEGMPLQRNVGCLPGVFRYSNPANAGRIHVTEKSLPLMRDIVEICEPGGRILDPFAGAGTTILAAVREGYEAVGIEKTAVYYKLGSDRVKFALAAGEKAK